LSKNIPGIKIFISKHKVEEEDAEKDVQQKENEARDAASGLQTNFPFQSAVGVRKGDEQCQSH
jgi:hypothetical protein